jgi:hypothetical protein
MRRPKNVLAVGRDETADPATPQKARARKEIDPAVALFSFAFDAIPPLRTLAIRTFERLEAIETGNSRRVAIEMPESARVASHSVLNKAPGLALDPAPESADAAGTPVRAPLMPPPLPLPEPRMQIPTYAKSEKVEAFIGEAIESVAAFADFTPMQRALAIRAMERRVFAPGERLVSPNAPFAHFGVVQNGVFETTSRRIDEDEELVLERIEAGGCLGDGALYATETGAPLVATKHSITCKTTGAVFRLGFETFQEIKRR